MAAVKEPNEVAAPKGSIRSYREAHPRAFEMLILNDSTAPDYLPGDTVVIDPDQGWENGATCAVQIDVGVSLKVFHDHGSEVIVEPVNGKGPSFVAKKSGKLDSRVVGKVVGVIAAADQDGKHLESLRRLWEGIETLNDWRRNREP